MQIVLDEKYSAKSSSAPHIQLSPSWPVFAHFGEEVEAVVSGPPSPGSP